MESRPEEGQMGTDHRRGRKASMATYRGVLHSESRLGGKGLCGEGKEQAMQ